MHKYFGITIIALFFQLACTNTVEKVSHDTKPTKIIHKTSKSPKKEAPKASKIKKNLFPMTTASARKFLLDYGEKNTETKGKIETKFGTIYFKLYKNTPLHRANFVFLVKAGYFDKTVFQRVVYDFIIQGGSDDSWDIAKLRNHYGKYLLAPEFKNKHRFGAMAMARQWENNPDKLSDPFEFYIVVDPNGTHHLDKEHTVFGQVTKGFNVLRKIEKVKIDSREWPIDDIDLKVTVY